MHQPEPQCLKNSRGHISGAHLALDVTDMEFYRAFADAERRTISAPPAPGGRG
jgi:hypothetical protein